jgi:hypothetical protein
MKAMAALATLSMTAGGVVVSAGGAASAAAPVKFGTLATPCGHGSPSGSPDTGVSASTIKLGYGDDAGYHSTNAAMGKAVAALIKWCNAQGGINGRTIAGDYQDAAVFNAKQAIDNMIANHDFMIAGQGYAFDSAGEADRLAADLVSVNGFTASTDTQNAWEMYQSVPNPADFNPVSSAYAGTKLFGATAVQKACAFRTDDLPGGASKSSDLKVEYSYSKAGWKFGNGSGGGWGSAKTTPSDFSTYGCDQNVSFLANISAPATINQASLNFKNSGTKTIYWAATPNATFTSFLADNAANKYNPYILTESSTYDPSLAKWNKKGYGNNVYTRIAFEPVEAASAVPAVKQYIALVGADNASSIGMQAASSFLLWATAAKSCGNSLTRQCVVNYLGNPANFAGSKAWTGGGLQGGTNPATNVSSTCGIVVHLKGTKWVQAYPTKLGQFDCATKYAQDTSAMLPYLPNGSQTGITLTNRHVGAGNSAIKPQ